MCKNHAEIFWFTRWNGAQRCAPWFVYNVLIIFFSTCSPYPLFCNSISLSFLGRAFSPLCVGLSIMWSHVIHHRNGVRTACQNVYNISLDTVIGLLVIQQLIHEGPVRLLFSRLPCMQEKSSFPWCCWRLVMLMAVFVLTQMGSTWEWSEHEGKEKVKMKSKRDQSRQHCT